jgi:hypothetical protein
LILAGDIERAQAVVFVEHHMATTDSELAVIQFRWIRKFLLRGAERSHRLPEIETP